MFQAVNRHCAPKNGNFRVKTSFPQTCWGAGWRGRLGLTAGYTIRSEQLGAVGVGDKRKARLGPVGDLTRRFAQRN